MACLPEQPSTEWSREKTGIALLVVGVVLLAGFALLLLNAFRSAEAVSLALAVLFVIFGFDLTRKGMARIGVSDGQPPAQQPVYYYQPYYGYYQYQAPPQTASPYHPGAAPPSPQEQPREQTRGREAPIRPEQYSQFR